MNGQPIPPSRWRTLLLPRAAATQAAISDYLTKLRSTANLKLNLGCGDHPIPDLINCDLYSPRADRKIDVKKLDIFSNNTVDHIEAHHLFEHLSVAERGPTLNEWNRVLKEGGYLVLSVPDLTAVCLRWIRHNITPATISTGEALQYTELMFYGPQSNPGMFHRSGYSRRTIAALLLHHGFAVEFATTPYPLRRTPSLFVVARKAQQARSKTHRN